MPAPHKPRTSMVAIAIVLACVSAAALAQSAPDAPQSVAAAVVSIGVVALDPAAASSAPASIAERSASINGSGFFVNKQGHVITALHVVRAAERARDEMKGTDNRLMVGLRSGAGFVAVPAELIGNDEAHDPALLRTKLPAQCATS
ncbi:MAG TPA: serine protease [Terriglobales bacterium]